MTDFDEVVYQIAVNNGCTPEWLAAHVGKYSFGSWQCTCKNRLHWHAGMYSYISLESARYDLDNNIPPYWVEYQRKISQQKGNL